MANRSSITIISRLKFNEQAVQGKQHVSDKTTRSSPLQDASPVSRLALIHRFRIDIAATPSYTEPISPSQTISVYRQELLLFPSVMVGKGDDDVWFSDV